MGRASIGLCGTEIGELWPYSQKGVNMSRILPVWENSMCVRCTEEEIYLGEVYCWACVRDINRQNGDVGPIFGYENWWS